MIPERLGESAKKMVQGQLPNEPKLRVIRNNGHHFDSAEYVFAGGFKMVATRHGVSFAGSCTSLKRDGVRRIKVYLGRAVKIAEELAENKGLVPEQEFDGLRLRGKKEGELHIAWYEGCYEKRVEHTDRATAVRTLRLNWITVYGAKT